MSDRDNSVNWVVWIALLPALMTPVLVPLMAANRVQVAAVVMRWHGVLEQGVLLVAGFALFMAVLGGVRTWRRVSNRHA